MKSIQVVFTSTIFVLGCSLNHGSLDSLDEEQTTSTEVVEDIPQETDEAIGNNAQSINQESSPCGFAPTPIASVFYSDNTALVEIFIFAKAAVGQGTLVDTIQFDRNINNAEIELFLLEFNQTATIPIGQLAPNGCDELGRFRQCQLNLEPQDFNVIAVSTNTNGESVSLVNTDYCGNSPGFEFEDIDGQVDVNSMASILSALDYPDYRQLLAP